MDQKKLKQHLTGIEKLLWTNNAVLYKENLIGEALLVFPETGMITRETALNAISEENASGRKWAEVKFSEEHCRLVDDKVALLTYKVVARWHHEKSYYIALASSLYVNTNNGWKVAFHQQSPLQEENRQ